MKQILRINYKKYHFDMIGVEIDKLDTGQYIIDLSQADLDILRKRLFELEQQSALFLPNEFTDYPF